AGEGTTDEERSRRLESDAEAVQVLTIHRSKGLEFPVVYFPFLWEPGWIPRDDGPIFFHDQAAGDARVIDVGMEGPDYRVHRAQYEAEQRGEDLRLAYVALTRAQHQAVVWWAGSWDSRNSALGRLLFARDAEGNVPPAGTATPSDAAAWARFEEVAAAAPGCVSVERSTVGSIGAWSGEPRAAAELAAASAAPLGPLVDDVRLRDVGRADRLDELEFELPLAGGDAPTGRVTLTAIASVLRRDPALASYAGRLEDPALRQSVRGYLTGSIDVVVRVGDRYAVVDYKTNWLGPPGEELSAWHHRPAALAAEMQRMHYVLQALLYTVALHRYLRWRVPGYDPDRHLAGVMYLFVRGMVGLETPMVDGTPCGVFAWRPSAALVEELSGVLDGGRAS